MCGWPVGVAFPAQDSELEAHAAEQSATSEVETAENEEQAGAQLDALSTMVDRQAEASVPDAPPVEAVAEVEEIGRGSRRGTRTRHGLPQRSALLLLERLRWLSLNQRLIRSLHRSKKLLTTRIDALDVVAPALQPTSTR